MKLILENFRKYELLCEIEREIEEYGPLDEGKIDEIFSRLDEGKVIDLIKGMLSKVKDKKIPGAVINLIKRALNKGIVTADVLLDAMASAMVIPKKEAIAMLLFAGISITAGSGLAAYTYNTNVEKAAHAAEMQAEKEASRIPWTEPKGRPPLPAQLWEPAPPMTIRGLPPKIFGSKIYVPYNKIPDDYVLAMGHGHTKEKYRKFLDGWDKERVEALVWGDIGKWGYGTWKKHPDRIKDMAGAPDGDMLPPAWSVAYAVMLSKQKNL